MECFGLFAIFFFCSIAFFSSVKGAVFMSRNVECLPEAPEICVGEMVGTSPSPEIVDGTGTMTYTGGWSWRFDFVEGLEEGDYYENYEVLEAAKTGLVVSVYLMYDRTICDINVGGESCNSCTAEGCGFASVKYDCSNLEDGIASQDCVSIDKPFLYPFEISGAQAESMETLAPTSGTSSGPTHSTTSSPTSNPSFGPTFGPTLGPTLTPTTIPTSESPKAVIPAFVASEEALVSSSASTVTKTVVCAAVGAAIGGIVLGLGLGLICHRGYSTVDIAPA